MGLKDLLVHVNVSKHCPARVAIAARLAKTFDARLTGLFTTAADDVAFYMVEEMALNAEPTMRAWWLRVRDKVKAEFEEALRRTGTTTLWLEVGDKDGSAVSQHARYADLTIVGQIDPEEPLPRPEYKIPERVALDSGCPVLVVPYAGNFTTLGSKVLIAWNSSAQSARAVRDSLPLLRKAESVTILTINTDSQRRDEPDRPDTRIVTHLAHHGIVATARELVVDDATVGETILSQASEEGVDLIVMGAYGHSRASEFVLGGATRTMFRQMTVPILVSH
jgi:nucleotide-binding universal stress UspA family protein